MMNTVALPFKEWDLDPENYSCCTPEVRSTELRTPYSRTNQSLEAALVMAVPLCVQALNQTGWRKAPCVHMATVSNQVSTRELRNQLSDVLGRAMYEGERIGVTRNGKLAAVVVSVADLEALEAFEM